MRDLTKLTELAQTISGGLQANAVSLVERMGEVIEGLGDRPIEFRPGTLKLVQGTSDRGKLPKGAGIGSLVLGEDILEAPYRVLVLRHWTSRQYWDPNPENAKMLCNSPDATVGFQYGDCKVCPYSKFDEQANKSQCNKTISVLCLSADLKELFVVNFSKTNYMNGVDWTNLMKKAGVAPYKRVYTLASKTSTKSKNVELLHAEPVAGERTEGEVLAFVEELFRISGDDRKEMLLKFHEYAANKKKAGVSAQLEAPSDVVLLTHDEDAPTETAEPVAIAVTEVMDGGKPAKGAKYKM